MLRCKLFMSLNIFKSSFALVMLIYSLLDQKITNPIETIQSSNQQQWFDRLNYTAMKLQRHSKLLVYT